jgi:hypothetical protein
MVRAYSSLSAARSRNMVLEKLETLEAGLGRRADWTVWFDDDMIFPGDTIAKLLSHGKEIVGASYLRRTEPHDLLGLPEGSSVQGFTGISPFKRLPAGCLLVKRDVFDKVGRWTLTEELGEDVFFCERAREAGYTVWCDLDLTREVKHVAEKILEAETEISTLVLPQPRVESLIGIRGNGRG